LDLLAAEEDQQLVLEAAKALAIIAEGDGDGVLTKRNHAVIRVRAATDDRLSAIS
jgi:hypothetical protein